MSPQPKTYSSPNNIGVRREITPGDATDGALGAVGKGAVKSHIIVVCYTIRDGDVSTHGVCILLICPCGQVK